MSPFAVMKPVRDGVAALVTIWRRTLPDTLLWNFTGGTSDTGTSPAAYDWDNIEHLFQFKLDTCSGSLWIGIPVIATTELGHANYPFIYSPSRALSIATHPSDESYALGA